MNFRLFNAIVTDIATVPDGQLVAAYLTLRDRLVAGERPVVMLNTLFNLTSSEMVRRSQQERAWEMLHSCDLCDATVSEHEGRWVFDNFVCAPCVPPMLRQLV